MASCSCQDPIWPCGGGFSATYIYVCHVCFDRLNMIERCLSPSPLLQQWKLQRWTSFPTPRSTSYQGQIIQNPNADTFCSLSCLKSQIPNDHHTLRTLLASMAAAKQVEVRNLQEGRQNVTWKTIASCVHIVRFLVPMIGRVCKDAASSLSQWILQVRLAGQKTQWKKSYVILQDLWLGLQPWHWLMPSCHAFMVLQVDWTWWNRASFQYNYTNYTASALRHGVDTPPCQLTTQRGGVSRSLSCLGQQPLVPTSFNEYQTQKTGNNF